MNSTVTRYPTACTHLPSPDGEVCAEPLIDSEGNPFKTFTYHSFHDYVGTLLCRPDFREMFSTFRSRARGPQPEIMRDVEDGAFVRLLKGPDGRLFMDVGEPSTGGVEEFRLLFALNVDGFQVEGNNLHGISRNATVVSLSCVSLPASIRFKPGNPLVVCVIPGEPGLGYIHHYLTPVINDIKDSYEQGVRYIIPSSNRHFEPGEPPTSSDCHPDSTESPTSSHHDAEAHEPSSRHHSKQGGSSTEKYDARCALGPVVCDAVAARVIAGLFPYNSNWFCYVCKLWNLATSLGQTNYEDWEMQDGAKLRECATLWNETSSKGRQAVYKDGGCQHSELNRLSFWNAVMQLVVDPMHGFNSRCARMHSYVALQLFDGSTKKNSPGRVACYSFDFEFPPRPSDILLRSQTESTGMEVVFDDNKGPSSKEDTKGNGENDPNEVEMDVDEAFDSDLAFGGAEKAPRTYPEGEAGVRRRSRLQELRTTMTANACRDVLLIHRRLTAPLDDEPQSPVDASANKRTPSPRAELVRGLANLVKPALEFVAVDLEVAPLPIAVTTKTGISMRTPSKEQYAEALVTWVSAHHLR